MGFQLIQQRRNDGKDSKSNKQSQQKPHMCVCCAIFCPVPDRSFYSHMAFWAMAKIMIRNYARDFLVLSSTFPRHTKNDKGSTLLSVFHSLAYTLGTRLPNEFSNENK